MKAVQGDGGDLGAGGGEVSSSCKTVGLGETNAMPRIATAGHRRWSICFLISLFSQAGLVAYPEPSADDAKSD